MIVLDPQDTGCKLPIKIWTAEKNFSPPESDSAAYKGWQLVWKQLNNLANHPLAVRHVCAMPDFHPGYGMPIGGVLATRRGVVPNAVGSDIGCGMIAQRLNIQADDLNREDLKALQQAIYKRVPVGFQHHNTNQRLSMIENVPAVPKKGAAVIEKFWDRAAAQLGTLGSGNHFIELQRCDEDGRLWLMLHSGSRRIGKEVGDHYDKIAQAYMQSFKVDVDKELAFLPDTVPEYEQYLADMRWCMKYAEANRQAMLAAVHAAFKSLGCKHTIVDIEVETHHNFAAMEYHFGENLMIHRKGAVRATGLVTIPGSMGTASFIGDGLTPRESFNTCSHGGGRVMGRGEANRTITHNQAVESMEDVVFEVREGQYDEMPGAYKPIDEVMAAQADLVRPLYRLTPLTVVKG